jgi:acetoin utilization deacetylase AcuC-like enzyme
MKIIYNDVFKEHDTGMHPENRKRLDVFGPLAQSEIEADESLLNLVHVPDYIHKVKSHCAQGLPLDGDTHTSTGSYNAAVKAANATLMAAQNQDMALVRPPGHHAYRDRASGFCLFNNVAIASQYFVEQGKRVLIFDFDGHLGDGTSHIFYDTDKVMYWSIHQFPAFPGHGNTHEIGRGEGKGFTVNVPLPPGSGDDIYDDALYYTLPIALQFNPDIVAVSAGFDAHQYDLLLELRLSLNSFYNTGRIISKNFNRFFATLEGGYNVEELPRCVHNFMNGINVEKMKYKENRTESDIKVWNEYELRIDDLLTTMKKYWDI